GIVIIDNTEELRTGAKQLPKRDRGLVIPVGVLVPTHLTMREVKSAKGIILDVESDGSEAKVEVSIFLPDEVAKVIMHTLQLAYGPGDKRGH
ncbi:MAG: hypothetical protein V3T23_08110, partial [Nitrososphaerales archaeon]